MNNRKLGYTGQVLDHAALTTKVLRILQLTHGLDSTELASVEVPELLLVEAGPYRIGVVCHEGVGTRTDDAGLVRIDVQAGPFLDAYSVYLAPRVLRWLETSETRDLAEWVRVFGDRLDVNVIEWQRWLDAGK